ncbi:hypothetical protein GQ600_23801 [Phytophthora cactorum]|nr:hypothetical protein GQ600_23801 [Phytophthora cactorum]
MIPWVAAEVKTQYDMAVSYSVSDSYVFKDNVDTITVNKRRGGGGARILVVKEGWTCDCKFSQTMKLLCRHAMVYINTCGNPLVIPFAAISPRFCPGITLQSTCRDALCCSWVNTEVKRAVDDPLPPTLIFGELLECWPYTRLRGFGLSYSDLFCFMGSAWLNGDAMRAFNKILARFKNNKNNYDSSKRKEHRGGGGSSS